MMAAASRTRRWYRRFKRRHPVPLWAHLAFVIAFVPGYVFLLGLDAMAAPDIASRVVIVVAQFLCFYLAILFLLPRAFRYRRDPWATAGWLIAYLVLDFVLVSCFLLAISLGSGALRFHWDERGYWVGDIINLSAVAVATCYLAGLAAITYQLAAQSILFYRHRENFRKLLDQKRTTIQALELEWLRLQLDPHLIAGLLSRIRLMSQKDPEELWKAMNRVIAIMQYYCSIPPTAAVVPLGEEVAQVKNFLALQELGRSKLYIRVHIAEEVLSVWIVPMLLLMLVENQVKHGVLGDPMAPALLQVSPCANLDGLQIVTLNHIPKSYAERKTISTGLGQKLIESRLAQTYPNQYQFRYGRDDSGRYRVEVCIHMSD